MNINRTMGAVLCFAIFACSRGNPDVKISKEEIEVLSKKIHDEASIVISHLHEFSGNMMDQKNAAFEAASYKNFGDVNFAAKAVKILTDFTDWKGGQRVNGETIVPGEFNQRDWFSFYKTRRNVLFSLEKAKKISIVKRADQIKPSRVPNVIMALEGDVGRLKSLYKDGLRQLQLYRQASKKNLIFDKKSGALSAYAKALIQESNRLGIAIDVSHMEEALGGDIAIKAVIDLSNSPVMISHRNPKKRSGSGLSNRTIKNISLQEGVIGLHFFKPYIDPLDRDNHFASSGKDYEYGGNYVHGLAHAALHIKKLVGNVDSIVLGVDFFRSDDGSFAISDFTELPLVTKALLDHGFTEQEILKIYGENLKKYYAAVWKK